jgi:hypothetical protein
MQKNPEGNLKKYNETLPTLGMGHVSYRRREPDEIAEVGELRAPPSQDRTRECFCELGTFGPR